MNTHTEPAEFDLQNLNVIAIVQARMGASRLPGKVLADICGQPMLVRVVERARRARSLTDVLVATTQEPEDDQLIDLCNKRGYRWFRGSEQDVLDRYYRAARDCQAEVIVRITADCPVIDPLVIDQTVFAFFGLISPLIVEGQTTRITSEFNPGRLPWDFAANRLPPPWKRTFPIGLDTEVCTFAALERAWHEAREPHHREHVMPYLYEAEGNFRVLLVNHSPDYGNMRWTVDTTQDLELLREIYNRFEGRDDFSWLDVLTLFQREPGLADINREVPHKDYRVVEKRRG